MSTVWRYVGATASVVLDRSHSSWTVRCTVRFLQIDSRTCCLACLATNIVSWKHTLLLHFMLNMWWLCSRFSTCEIKCINYQDTGLPPIRNSSVESREEMCEHIVNDLTFANTKRIRFEQDPEFKSLIDSRSNSAILDYLNKDNERDKLAHFQASLVFFFRTNISLTRTDSGRRPPTDLQQWPWNS